MEHLEHCDFGYEYAGETMIVAAGITADGTKLGPIPKSEPLLIVKTEPEGASP